MELKSPPPPPWLIPCIMLDILQQQQLLQLTHRQSAQNGVLTTALPIDPSTVRPKWRLDNSSSNWPIDCPPKMASWQQLFQLTYRQSAQNGVLTTALPIDLSTVRPKWRLDNSSSNWPIDSPPKMASWQQLFQLTYRQSAQNGFFTDLLCRATFCVHLSILPMKIATTIA